MYRDGDVLFLAPRITETEIDVLDLLLFNDLQDVAGCRHGSSGNNWSVAIDRPQFDVGPVPTAWTFIIK
jgi:hypothetical protein